MSFTTRSLTCIVRSLVPMTSSKQSLPLSLQYCHPGSLHKTSINITRCFQSDIHTDNLYPGSKVSDKFASVEIKDIANTSSLFNGIIPIKELDLTYSGSSAPGGQNVNKNSTKVEARFKLETASWLSKEAKDILKEKWTGQLTKDGYFVVKSERTRSRHLNQVNIYFYRQAHNGLTKYYFELDWAFKTKSY